MKNHIVLNLLVLLAAGTAACLCGAAYWFIAYSFWFFIPAYVMLFYNHSCPSIPYFLGFVWGAIVFGLFILPFLVGAYKMTEATALWCLGFVLTLYLAATATVWFWSVQRILSFFNEIKWRIIVWSFFFFLYAWFIGNHVLRLVQFGEGIFFLKPHLLAAYGLFLFSNFMPLAQQRDAPAWLTRVKIVRPAHSTVHGVAALEDFFETNQALLTGETAAQLCITHESAFPFFLNTNESCTHYLNDYCALEQCMFGSYYYDADAAQSYNACYCFKRGTCCAVQYKRHGVPCIEYLPAWLNDLGGESYFFKNYNPFEQACVDQVLYKIVLGKEQLVVAPLICSEFFCTTFYEQPAFDDRCVIYVVMVNDQWLPRFCAELLLWYARMQALWYKKPLIYSSWHYAVYLDQYGYLWSV